MLVALGYNADVENYVGDDWDLYVNVQANQDGLYVDLLDVADLTTTNLSREHTAQMIWNMLQAYTVKQTSTIDKADGSVKLNYAKSDTTMFTESYRGYFKTGILKGFSHDTGKWTYWIDDVKVKCTVDYTAWLGQSVKVAYNNDSKNAAFKANEGTAYGIFHDEGAVLAEAQFGDLGKIKANDNTIDIGGKTFRMDKGAVRDLPVYEFTNGAQDYSKAPYEPVTLTTTTSKDNGQVRIEVKDVDGKVLSDTIATNWTVVSEVTKSEGLMLYAIAGQYFNSDVNRQVWQTRWDHQKFTAVDQDDDGQIDFLMVVPYDVAQVTNVNGSKVTLNVLQPGGSTRAGSQFVEDVVAYDGIKTNDWVIYTHDKNTVDNKATLVKAETVSGTISAANNRLPDDSAKATMDGVQYTFSNYFDTTMGTTNDLCKVGNRLDNAVIVNGYIFAVDNVKKAAIKDYALVTGMSVDDGVSGDRVKLLFWDKSSAIVSPARGIDWDSTTSSWYIPNSVNASSLNEITVGTLVKYSKNADGDYILTKAEVGNNGYNVDWAVWGAEKRNNNTDNAGYLYGDAAQTLKATINKDAVIYVRYQTPKQIADRDAGLGNSYSYKVITGSQLQLNEYANILDQASTNINSLVLGSRMNNKFYVELAYVDVGTQKTLEDSDIYYGYVVDNEGLTGMQVNPRTNETVRALPLWTTSVDENGNVTVGFVQKYFAGTISVWDAANGYDLSAGDAIRGIAADTEYRALLPGTIVKYKQNSDGDITEILGFYDADNAVNNIDTGTVVRTGAITTTAPLTIEYNARVLDPVSGNYVTVKRTVDGVDTAVEHKYFNTDDAAIFCVDNTAQAGVAVDRNSIIRQAGKNGDNFVANATIIYDADKGTVALIVVDSGNEIAEGRPVYG